MAGFCESFWGCFREKRKQYLLSAATTGPNALELKGRRAALIPPGIECTTSYVLNLENVEFALIARYFIL